MHLENVAGITDMWLIEGVRSKRAFFVFRPSTQDQKGLSDTNKFFTPLALLLLTPSIIF